MTRKKKMNTFDTLQTLFTQDLRELHQIRKRGWFTLPMSRLIKEENIGRCCYLAEEFLSPAELCTLKQEIGLDELQWRAYKSRLSEQ
jgi:hypothetical protein